MMVTHTILSPLPGNIATAPPGGRCPERIIVKHWKKWITLLPAAAILTAILAATDNSSSIAENQNLSKVTFVVS